jgi:hypothetical protein
MAYKMKGFGGFKASPTKLNKEYEQGFKKMTDKELKDVVKRQKQKGTSKETAFSSIKEAETSRDSLNTAQNTLRLRKLDKMDPSGKIRKSAPTKANKKLIDIAGEMGKKGRDKLKSMLTDLPVARAYKKAKKLGEKIKKSTKINNLPKKVKNKGVAKGIKPAMSKTEQQANRLQKQFKNTFSIKPLQEVKVVKKKKKKTRAV